MNLNELTALGKACGFDQIAALDPATVELREDVREMCASNSCSRYNKCWSCPPACGTLEACRDRITGYNEGILVQTVGELEDEFDGEGMMDAERRHKEAFEAMYEKLRKVYPGMIALGAGSCTRCKKCSYPDAPCRFPDKMTSSMEAYGILVQQVCKSNGVKYYYGRNTIAYTGCFLLR